MNVMSIGKLLVTSENSQGRSVMNVMNVGKPFVKNSASTHYGSQTRKRV